VLARHDDALILVAAADGTSKLHQHRLADELCKYPGRVRRCNLHGLLQRDLAIPARHWHAEYQCGTAQMLPRKFGNGMGCAGFREVTMKAYAAVMFVLIAGLSPATSSAIPLAEFSIPTGVGFAQPITEFRSTFFVGSSEWIIEPLVLTNHSRTFQATRARVSHFALLEWDSLTAALTNGLDDTMGWGTGFAFTGGGGSVSSEESFFFNLNGPNPEGDITATTFVPLLNGIDLAGYSIRRISMQMELAQVIDSPPGTSPFQVAGRAKFTIHGSLARPHSVPEPNSLALFALGLLGVLFAKRRRHVWRKNTSHPWRRT
jgi:hypothetical protein